uniref:Brinker DNA-binding domain-containing protein n=1 Tax=Clastoptera arizonana TaxID=38151 RepID=A0A1B6CQ94_9HEMI
MAHGVKQEWEDHPSPPTSVKQTANDEKKVKSDGKSMGSRRIFSPQFKLQVLNSYRSDKDCKGNQRATARKYGIHRRQIQKWLQMESNLRSTVQASENNTSSDVETALNLSSPRQRDASVRVEIESNACCLDSAPTATPVSTTHDPSDVEIEINVDENSSSDDDDISSSDSLYDHSDQALDFTCANLSKRRFFSNNFKLEVLDAFHNDKSCFRNQRATARKFGIHRRQVQKWLKLEHFLRGDNNECLDLSCKKRKAEDMGEAEVKRMSPTWCTQGCTEVTSIQDTALCLVKPRTPHEVTSSVDFYYHPTSTLCYLSPTELPTYDPITIEPISSTWHAPYYPAYPIEYVPKWFSHGYSANHIKVYNMYR